MPLAFPLDPSVYGGLLVLFLGHAWLARDRGATIVQTVYFMTGLIVIWIALETPISILADRYLQSAHMVKHMLLLAYAPPFLLLGLTPAMAGALLRLPLLGRLLTTLTQPIPAQIINAVVIVGWHLPPLYELGLRNIWFHVAEHLTFLSAGVLYWWPLIRSTGSQSSRPLSDPQRFIYLFVGSFPMMAVSLPLQFSRVLFYPFYARVPAVLPGITAVLDQNIAGVVMMVMDMAALATDAVVVFYRWIGRELQADYEELDRQAAGDRQGGESSLNAR